MEEKLEMLGLFLMQKGVSTSILLPIRGGEGKAAAEREEPEEL